MTSVLTLVACNAVIAAILALITLVLTRLWRSPQLAHGLWLLVLLKLVTPPLFNVSVPSGWLAASPVSTESSLHEMAGVRDEVGDRGYFDQAASTAAADTELAESPAPAVPGDTALDMRDNVGVVAPGAGDRTFDFASTQWSTILGAVWIVGSIVYFSL